MTRYAASTTVSVEKSKSEIERLLSRYGASAFASGWAENRAVIQFEAQGRRIRFTLPLPDKNERRFTMSQRGLRSVDVAQKEWEQSCRQSWRALALVIKAKLEAVEAKITEFQDEFLAHIVLPDGQTVADHVKPKIKMAYETGNMLPLLPGPQEKR